MFHNSNLLVVVIGLIEIVENELTGKSKSVEIGTDEPEHEIWFLGEIYLRAEFAGELVEVIIG